jgi:purine nucleosidase
MPRKVLLDVDPGVADALAVCLAVDHEDLDVVAVTATGGNVAPRQASRNVQALIESIDPRRWPRIGVADESQLLRTDGRGLWGTDGFCGAELRVAELHQQHPSTKVMADEIRAASGELTIIAGGPLTNLARLLRLEPELATQIGHLVIVGGTLNGPGDVTPAAEFNVYCDAVSAQFVLGSPVTKTLLPIDIASQAPMTFDLLSQVSHPNTRVGELLERLLPGAFQAFRQRRGIEGMLVPEAIAVAAVLHAEVLHTEPLPCDVETAGNLTHGATVIDRRGHTKAQPNADVATEIDAAAAIDCILRGLRRAV